MTDSVMETEYGTEAQNVQEIIELNTRTYIMGFLNGLSVVRRYNKEYKMWEDLLINEEGRVLRISNEIVRLHNGYYCEFNFDNFFIIDRDGKLLVELETQLEGMERRDVFVIEDEGMPFVVCHEIRSTLDGKQDFLALYDQSGQLIMDLKGIPTEVGGNRIVVETVPDQYHKTLYAFHKNTLSLEELQVYENGEGSFKGFYEYGNEENSWIIIGDKEAVDYQGNVISFADRKDHNDPHFFARASREGLVYFDNHFYDLQMNPVVDLTEYSDKYYEAKGSSYQFLYDEHAVSDDQDIRDQLHFGIATRQYMKQLAEKETHSFRNEYYGVSIPATQGLKTPDYFYTIYTSSGEQLFEPRMGHVYNNIFDDRYIAWNDGKVRCCDFDGNLNWEIPGKLLSVSENIICLYNTERNAVGMYNWKGELLYEDLWIGQPVIKEKPALPAYEPTVSVDTEASTRALLIPFLLVRIIKNKLKMV